jgi:magnesium transporter
MLRDSPADIAAETEEMHPANLADVAATLEPDQVRLFLRALPPARAADVLEYLGEELRTDVLEAMSTTQAAALVSEMTPDDRADVLDELEEGHAEEILAEISGDARGETERLLAYPPESAGGIMTTEFVSVPESMTVEDALTSVRAVARGGRREAMHSI